MQNIDKTLLAKNIKYLAEQKGIKIGVLEDKIGVSTGYFSRLANEESKQGSSQLDIIFAAANVLKISINTLISTDLSSFTPNEKLLSEFFDTLQKDTEKGSLLWDLESKKMFDDYDFVLKHPLFNSEGDYHSEFDNDAIINGDGYNCDIKNVKGTNTLYLMNVFCKETNAIGFELYFLIPFFDETIGTSSYYVEKICKAYPKSNLYNQISLLYNDAAESSRHLKLSDSVLSTIQGYIKQSTQADAGFSTEPPPIRI